VFLFLILYYMRHKKKMRSMRGGFLENISSTLSNLGSSLTESASSIWNKTRSLTSSSGSSVSSYVPTTTASPTYTTTTSPTYGGRKTRRLRRMRGGYSSNVSLTNLAATAGPVSGIKTVHGGRKRRQRRTNKRRR
jgi:hypothetical protein